jgi:hypothetical protein
MIGSKYNRRGEDCGLRIADGKIEWPEGLETFRPFFFQGCDFTNGWSG